MSIGRSALTDGDRLDATAFDGEIRAHGAPAIWRRARFCPCAEENTGHPALDCTVCNGEGVNWDAGQALRLLAINRVRDEVYDAAGQRMEGLVWLTFPTGISPGHLDRVELQASVVPVNNERHVRGATRKPGGPSTERLRIYPALSVEYCEAKVDGELAQYAFFTDFVIQPDGTISWQPNRGPSAGTAYTMRYTVRETFLCWAPVSRDEGGQRMPYRCRAQRYDFFRRKAVGDA